MALTRTQPWKSTEIGSMPKTADTGTTESTHRAYLTFLRAVRFLRGITRSSPAPHYACRRSGFLPERIDPSLFTSRRVPPPPPVLNKFRQQREKRAVPLRGSRGNDERVSVRVRDQSCSRNSRFSIRFSSAHAQYMCTYSRVPQQLIFPRPELRLSGNVTHRRGQSSSRRR